MNILNTKEEALANAAKNNSSEQVSLTCHFDKGRQHSVNEPENRKSEHVEEQVKTVAECGSSLGKGTEIYFDLIERQWRRVEERVMRRMEVMVKEMMENAMRMTREIMEKADMR
jgi:hypothetical protein